jgi:hypothetical protein
MAMAILSALIIVMLLIKNVNVFIVLDNKLTRPDCVIPSN